MQVIYEDNHLICLNKDAGLLSQGDKTGDSSVLNWAEDYIRVKYNKPGQVFTGLIHRLDRPVTGLICIARTSKGLERMNKLFREDQIQKYYLAVSHKRLSKERMTHASYLLKNRSNNTVRSYTEERKGAKYAETTFELVRDLDGKYVYLVTPKTGRSHQIRVHMADLGIPIIGDVKYGGRAHDYPRQILLHAYALSFVHPVKKELLLLKASPTKHEVWNQLGVGDIALG